MKRSLIKLSKQMDVMSKMAKRNAPTILTAVGIGGFVSTVVMAVKATPKAIEKLEEVDKRLPEDAKKSTIIFEKTKAVAPVYASTALMGATSIICVLEANKISSARLAAVTTAYELSERAFNEYKEAVVEKIGEKKEQEVRDEVAKRHVEDNPIKEDEVIQAATGSTLFMDSVSGRYFRSTKDDIYKALIRFNNWLITEDYMTLNEWYDELGIDHIKIGDRLGFNSTQGIDIYWSVQMTPNNEAVTVLEYRTPPTYDAAICNTWD